MKNILQAYRPSYLWFWPPLILGGSVISAGTIHDLRRVKVPAHFETPECSTFCRCSLLLKGCLHLRIGVSITNRNLSVWQNKYTNFKSLSDILIKLKTEFNAIGSGNWEWINFNRQLDDHKVIFSWRTLGQTRFINLSDRPLFCRSDDFRQLWLLNLTVAVLMIGQIKNKEPVELGDL
jgi:hypothetical protein